MFARRDSDPMRFQRATDGGMTKDVVRCCGLLNKPNSTPSKKQGQLVPVLCFYVPEKLDLYAHQGLISASDET